MARVLRAWNEQETESTFLLSRGDNILELTAERPFGSQNATAPSQPLHISSCCFRGRLPPEHAASSFPVAASPFPPFPFPYPSSSPQWMLLPAITHHLLIPESDTSTSSRSCLLILHFIISQKSTFSQQAFTRFQPPPTKNGTSQAYHRPKVYIQGPRRPELHRSPAGTPEPL
jgi:hypothetical protein